MKKYFKFITENYDSKEDTWEIFNHNLFDIDKSVELIKRDCKPFLEEINIPLYRGTWNDYYMAKLNRRRNRKPVDTYTEVHDILDNMFLEKFGWRARSEGVFVNQDAQNYYGDNLHLFFPIGKFKYLYSNTIDDLYTYFKGGPFALDYNIYLQDYDDNAERWEIKYETEEEWNADRLHDFKLAVDSYKDTGLPPHYVHEFMFDVDYYYMVNCNSSDVRKEIIKKLNLKD